jgi:transcriptional regulator with XRE-family HTH domain
MTTEGDDQVMTEPTEPYVGQRIRRIRGQHGLSLRALAENNTISLIERGENSPTVSSLNRLAVALNVQITVFFQQEADQLTMFVKNNQGRRFRGSGIVIESVGNGLLNPQFEALTTTVEPGYGNMDDPVTHHGEELVRCLEGQVEYYVENRRFRMAAGDNLLFEATQPHCFRNTSQAVATILTILQAGVGQHLAQSRLAET